MFVVNPVLMTLVNDKDDRVAVRYLPFEVE